MQYLCKEADKESGAANAQKALTTRWVSGKQFEKKCEGGMSQGV